jgi:rhodanese-related sulfurtransferase
MWKWIVIAIAVPALGLLLLRSRVSGEGTIPPNTAAGWIKDKQDLQLIDVRTAGEYAEGHLANAKLIPVQELESRLGEIDKNKPVLLYCRSGHRSGNALKTLQSHGYTDVKHLEGGIGAWKSAGFPVVK